MRPGLLGERNFGLLFFGQAASAFGDRLALPREREKRVGHSERVEEQQPLAVVDRVRRDLLRPALVRRPIRVRRLPVPESSLELAHGAMLDARPRRSPTPRGC